MRYAIILGIISLPLCPTMGAAAVVIDSFTEGSVSIGFANDTLDLDVITGTSADERRVWGNGVKDWTSTLATGSGNILYAVDLRGSPSLNQWLNLQYSNSLGYVDLSGYSSFTIDFSDITGQGILSVLFNDRQGTFVPITTNGIVEYPFDHVLDVGPIPEFLSRVQFRVFAGSSDFSVSINEIAIVPEPSPTMLALVSGVVLLTIPNIGRTRRPS
jgi:hypothetical protein